MSVCAVVVAFGLAVVAGVFMVAAGLFVVIGVVVVVDGVVVVCAMAPVPMRAITAVAAKIATILMVIPPLGVTTLGASSVTKIEPIY
ncbi:hypothetical protein [Rhizobium mayense]|uniref:Uncharacterized protein n=1 Tax=Rhizobium mayense TaxID=1312184 RepID=A0ABT7JS67_9HYPH|nr:hypothetical protein [Rhizobium mayense]MDL2399131.1 hypothetical protein [Rhizobium mayense]